MLKITFNPEAGKTALFDGRFKSREALVEACEVVALPDPAYEQWAADNGVDASSGSIITTAYSPDYRKRREATLADQVRLFKGEPVQTHLNFTVPPLLREAFAAAAQDHLTGKPFRVLTVSNTRETLFFDLRRDFPMLNMNMTCAINDPGHAGNNNYLLMRDAKEISGDLSYSTGWQPQAYDLVHVNAAIFYEDENGVKTLVHDIAATGPERVVFTNLINSSGDKPEWFAQRSRGGVVPMRALPPQEIVTLMQTAGYKLVDRQTAPATYNVQIGVDVSQLLQNDNLSFVKDHAPA